MPSERAERRRGAYLCLSAEALATPELRQRRLFSGVGVRVPLAEAGSQRWTQLALNRRPELLNCEAIESLYVLEGRPASVGSLRSRISCHARWPADWQMGRRRPVRGSLRPSRRNFDGRLARARRHRAGIAPEGFVAGLLRTEDSSEMFVEHFARTTTISRHPDLGPMRWQPSRRS